VLDIHVYKIEREQEQSAPIDDHHLTVVTNQVVGGAPDRDTSIEKAHLHSAQLGFPASVGMRDECANRNAPSRSVFQGSFQLFPVQAEDQNINTLFGALDRSNKRRDAVVGLYQQLQIESSVSYYNLVS